ncbi:bifunctional diguanylate cyclase/phosphodiesterase [Antrihabitans sp. YC2-6]|uniref:putative bifunctional diguanylate cyclase/phosphodiesterase n=1 Tax=Antrihabitans sp. YC2-6 TaxID=2799498 RepID=UPI0018F676BA|nr:EAL domain-containing protein [Antrihabitans sp. YC2-6]MBJ8344164.1 EAL domain-containing protein [Antrihabitans sp. YC2-6]
MTASMRPLASQHVAILCAVGVVALWCVGVFGGVLPTSTEQIVSNVGQVCAAYTAGIAAFVRYRLSVRRDLRRFWLLLSMATLAWGSGQASWSYAEIFRHDALPFPSVADIGFLALPPLAVLALLSLPVAAATTAGRFRSVLDGLLVAASTLLLGWVAVLRTVFDAGADSVFAEAVALAYPIGDVVVITVVLYTSMSERRLAANFRAPYILVGLGLIAITVADSGFAYLYAVGGYATGEFLDVGWFAGFIAILLGTLPWRGSDTPQPERFPATGAITPMLLPYAAVGGAIVTSVIDLVHNGTVDPFVSWLRTAIVVLLVVRQVLTLLENRSLTKHLEERVAARTAELRSSRERFAALVAHSSDVIMVVDRNATVTYQSDASGRVLGLAPEAMIGRPVSTMIGDTTEIEAFLEALEYTAAEPLRIHSLASTWVREADRRSVEVTLTNLLDNPDVAGIVLNIRNVSDRKVLEEQLVHQAFHDALTGMANRAHFRDRLERAVAERGSSSGAVSVLFMDLDGFKTVNDTLGHGSGDLILCEVADRIADRTGPNETVARIGGDEFAVLVEGSPDRGYLGALAERITGTLREPFSLDGREIHLGGSIGIADLTDDVVSGEQLLRNADLAMYEAKSAGDGSYAFFVPAMHEVLVERVRLEVDLRGAIETDGFEVFYQPLVSLCSGEITGVEALLRWHHPTRGLVDPAQFIPAAESTGLIRPLGMWVLWTACQQAAHWQQGLADRQDLRVNVNMSAKQLLQPDLVERIAEVLRETGLAASSLVLEMTEGVLMVDSEATLETLTGIRELGVRIAIDDFGTGYSSLSYLHHFPVDILKIDRSFIKGLSAGRDAALVRSIVSLAQSLGMETVAEGIERVQEVQLLRELGCSTGQGYRFSPAVPASAMSMILSGRNRDLISEPIGSSDDKR